MGRRSGYIFTNKTYSKKSIMSSVLGLIALVSLVVDVYLSFRASGAEKASYGAVCFLAMLYALLGAGLGVLARMEKDRFYLFANMGIVLNLAALAFVSMILYAGAFLG